MSQNSWKTNVMEENAKSKTINIFSNSYFTVVKYVKCKILTTIYVVLAQKRRKNRIMSVISTTKTVIFQISKSEFLEIFHK